MSENNNNLLSLALEESDTLPTRIASLERKLFDSSPHHKQLSRSSTTSDPPKATDVEPKGMKLPKLDVSVFNGNILNSTIFWVQFCISMHDRSNLSDTEKFLYVQKALKGGTAKSSNDGLIQSGENHNEAVPCLKARYNCPHLIHKAHVKMILDTAPLKDGNDKELRVLHDTVQQHVRVLNFMGYEPSGPFITSTITLKYSGVPHYQALLIFLDLCDQATEAHASD